MNLNEAFRALNALNEDTFSVSDDGIAKLADFRDNDDYEDEIKVIDVDAETEDDLEDSYVGKVILDCCVCHSKLYKDKAEIELNEDETLANVGEECPFCYTSDGFKVVGEVAAFGGDTETDETEDIDDEALTEAYEDTDGIMGGDKGQKYSDVDLKNYWEKEKDNDPVLKNYKDFNAWHKDTTSQMKKVNEGIFGKKDKQHKDDAVNECVSSLQESSGPRQGKAKYSDLTRKNINDIISRIANIKGIVPLRADDLITLKKQGRPQITARYLFYNPNADWKDRQDAALEANTLAYEKATGSVIDFASDSASIVEDFLVEYIESVCSALDITVVSYSHQVVQYSVEVTVIIRINSDIEFDDDYMHDEKSDFELESLTEEVNTVSVETDDSIVNVNTDDSGKITVTTEPKVTDVKDGEEVIVPLTDETQSAIQDAPIDDIPLDGEGLMDVSVDEFDEQSFDELGESYLKETYNNVESYRTTDVTSNNDSIMVEGVIRFTSGVEKKTSFIFEAKDCTRTGKYRLIGENKQLTAGKKAFTIAGKINEGKFITESFNYNYRTTDSEGKSSRVYGSKKR